MYCFASMLECRCEPKLGIAVQVSDREYQTGKSTTRDRLTKAEQMMKDGKEEDILFRDDDPVGTPVCARRFASLASKHGDDDMFSSDFTDQELQVTQLACLLALHRGTALSTCNSYLLLRLTRMCAVFTAQAPSKVQHGVMLYYLLTLASMSRLGNVLMQKLLRHLAEIPTLLVVGGEDECMPKSVDGRALGQRMQKAIGSKAQLKFIARGTHSLKGTEQEFVGSLQPFVQQCFGPGNAGIKPPYLYSCT